MRPQESKNKQIRKHENFNYIWFATKISLTQILVWKLALRHQIQRTCNSTLTQQLVKIPRDDFPALTRLVTSKSHKKALGSYDVDLINGFEDQIEDAFLLEQILSISQSSKTVLLLFMFCEKFKFNLKLFNGENT